MRTDTLDAKGRISNHPGALGAWYHESPNRKLEICFDTDDFALEAKRIKATGLALLHDITTEAWGQMTIRFYDPDHNIVELGESMRCFSRRLHAQGAGCDCGRRKRRAYHYPPFRNISMIKSN